jgi:hypothetical protein
MTPQPREDRYQPLALIGVTLIALIGFAVFFLSFLVAPLAILLIFYVGFGASHRSRRRLNAASRGNGHGTADPPVADGDADRRDAVLAEVRRVLALAAEVGEAVPSAADVSLATDPVLASYQLAALTPVGPLDRLALLAAPSVGERLEAVAALLADVEAVLASRLDGG